MPAQTVQEGGGETTLRSGLAPLARSAAATARIEWFIRLRWLAAIGILAFPVAGRLLFDKQRHKLQMHLPLDYPRRPPCCRMVTPVFHPNIDPL